jgi:dynein heavy chain
MVRGHLKPLVRAVLCAVITIDVHARDIITSLVEKKVDTSSNFEWLKQLRYYWDAHQEVALAKMANAQYFYGYEYLGGTIPENVSQLLHTYYCLANYCSESKTGNNTTD